MMLVTELLMRKMFIKFNYLFFFNMKYLRSFLLLCFYFSEKFLNLKGSVYWLGLFKRK